MSGPLSRRRFTALAKVTSALMIALFLVLPMTVLGQVNLGAANFAGGTVPGAVIFSSGSITCGTAAQACTFTAPSTTGPLTMSSATAATGGADVGYNLIVAGNLGGSPDVAFRVQDNNGASTLLQLFGDGGLTATGTLVGTSIAGSGTITSSRTTDLGWAIVTGANTACNTTCTNACVFGWDAGAPGALLACTDATADSCLCAGSS